MTDPEFLQTVDQLIEHGKQRRQEALQAANVDDFKEWDHTVTTFEKLVAGKRFFQLLRGK